MWEHNCTSNLAQPTREQRDVPNAARCLESHSACGYPLSFLLILEKSHLHKQGRPYLWTSTACLGCRNQYQGASLYRFRKAI